MNEIEFMATPAPWKMNKIFCMCGKCFQAEIWYYHEDKYNTYRVAEVWSRDTAQVICDIRNAQDSEVAEEIAVLYLKSREITRIEDVELRAIFEFEYDEKLIQNIFSSAIKKLG